MAKSRYGVWMSTSTTIAAGASAAVEVDVRGFIPLKIHIAGTTWTAANLGFKARAYNQSTSRVVYDDAGSPMQISGINSTSFKGCFAVPASPGLEGVCFLTPYKKSATAATTSAVNQTS